MTKVPRPALAMKVFITSKDGQQEQWEIAAVDHRARTYDARPFGINIDNQLWKIGLSMDSQYEPVPNRKNFERALEQWDYYSEMSDDSRIIQEGVSQKQALFEMFKKLPEVDKLYYRKILAIFQCE